MSELLKVFEFTAAQVSALTDGQSVADTPIVVDGVTVIPISKISSGFACGGSDLAQKKKADGIMAGSGVKVTRTPTAFLAVCDGTVSVLHAVQDDGGKNGLIAALKPLIAQLKSAASAKKAERTDA